MNENELKFFFRRFGIFGVALSWLALPILIPVVIADAIWQKLNRSNQPKRLNPPKT